MVLLRREQIGTITCITPRILYYIVCLHRRQGKTQLSIKQVRHAGTRYIVCRKRPAGVRD